MKIYYRNTQPRSGLRTVNMRRLAQAILDGLGESKASLSLSLVGDDEIALLNREYRGREGPTDVLSFPLTDPARSGKAAYPPDAERMLGDVVVSIDTARRQARDYGATLEAEIARLLVHGILHLLGYDHRRPAERKRMRAQERRLVEHVGLAWPFATISPA